MLRMAMDSLDSSKAEPVSGTCNEVRLLKNILITKNKTKHHIQFLEKL